MAIYQGSNRNKLSGELQSQDVVLTAYETMRSEWNSATNKGVLCSEKWSRVVLDERQFAPLGSST